MTREQFDEVVLLFKKNKKLDTAKSYLENIKKHKSLILTSNYSGAPCFDVSLFLNTTETESYLDELIDDINNKLVAINKEIASYGVSPTYQPEEKSDSEENNNGDLG